MVVEVDKQTVKRFADRNADLALAHIEAILADTSLLDEIPNGAHLIWLPDDDPGLAAYNRTIGERREREGKTVLYRRVAANAAMGDEG